MRGVSCLWENTKKGILKPGHIMDPAGLADRRNRSLLGRLGSFYSWLVEG